MSQSLHPYQHNDLPFIELCHLFEVIKNKDYNRDTKLSLLNKFWNFSYFKVNPLSSSCKQRDPRKVYSVLRLILPKNDTHRTSYGLQESKLAKKYAKILGIEGSTNDRKLSNFRQDKAGDFALVLYEVLMDRGQCPAAGQSPLTISEVNTYLDNIAIISHDISKEKELRPWQHLLTKATPLEHYYFVSIILKLIHLSLGEKSVLMTLHQNAYAQFNENSDLLKLCESICDPSYDLRLSQVHLFESFKPMLLSSITDHVDSSIKDSLNCISSKVEVSIDGANCPPTNYCIAEPKYDGERCLVHYEKSTSTLRAFSRNVVERTLGYLEVIIKETLSVESCILDGELMSWDPAAESYGKFGDSRSTIIKNSTDDTCAHLCYVAFDLLFLNGESLILEPWEKRQLLLENVVLPNRRMLSLNGHHTLNISTSFPRNITWLHVAPYLRVDDRLQIFETLEQCLLSEFEGIVVKSILSPYVLRNRSIGCFKLKPDHLKDGKLGNTVDVLILGGYYGRGASRGGRISQFLCGVIAKCDGDASWNENGEGNGKGKPILWDSFCKVGTGFTVDERQTLVEKLQNAIIKDCYELPSFFREFTYSKENQPDVWYDPEKSVVLEVRAFEVIPSSTYSSRFTLRFPRCDRIRYDKLYHQTLSATDIPNLNKMFSLGTKTAAELANTHSSIGSKRKQKRQQGNPKKKVSVDISFKNTVIASNIQVKSNIFQNYKFINLCNTDNKEESVRIETLIIENGGSVTQGFIPSDDPTINENNLILNDRQNNKTTVSLYQKLRLYNIVDKRWLEKCVSEGKVLVLTPSDIIAPSDVTRQQHAKVYDDYGDHFYEPLFDKDDLIRIVSNVIAKKKAITTNNNGSRSGSSFNENPNKKQNREWLCCGGAAPPPLPVMFYDETVTMSYRKDDVPSRLVAAVIRSYGGTVANAYKEDMIKEDICPTMNALELLSPSQYVTYGRMAQQSPSFAERLYQCMTQRSLEEWSK